MAKSKSNVKPGGSQEPSAAAPEATRYICVHGHFYQPPRENPWLETVEVQDSAAPYHDWNDRITAECYAPNGASRIVNPQNQIIRIINNYSRISFNFGPTLLSWLKDFAPRTYRMILDADIASSHRYSGHGSALAQVYNHIIMPLANERDARTQIRWGIADFESRFGRKPEGMWLAETAANRKVLDLMAQEGIKFTILAPNQCARVRRMPAPPAETKPDTANEVAGSPEQAQAPAPEPELAWSDTPNGSVDTTHPYLVPLEEGRSIAVFFYNGPGSTAIAFEGLLNSGENFGSRLLSGFHEPDPSDPNAAQLSHVATDGESYGHHHKHGEMALSYAMYWLETEKHVAMTNYGEFLDRFPPTWQAEIVDNTSWSCAHGVERWRSDCGCNAGHAGWNQQWRAPLREALDTLRDAVTPLAEKLSAGLFKDLWAARDAYISVILDRSEESKQRFLDQHAAHQLTPIERVQAFELMELERHTQLMYTSCGWFFDEISGIETVQVIAYAGRVLQLAPRLFGEPGAPLEQQFLDILAKAKSNVPEYGDGAQVYRRFVSPMRLDLEAVGAHYAISSIFRNYPEDGQLFCFDLHRDSHEVFSSGRGRVALGRAGIRSRITEAFEQICFAVLHLGDQNLSAAVKRDDSSDPARQEAFAAFSSQVSSAMRRANLPEVIRLIDSFFGHDPNAPQSSGQTPGQTHPDRTAYSLTSLFADEQHLILKTILNQTLSEMEDSLRKIYEDHASLLHYLTESGMSAPPALALAASFSVNASLRSAIEADIFDAGEVEAMLARAQAEHVTLDTTVLSYLSGQRMKAAMIRLEAAAAGEPGTSGTNGANTVLHTAVSIAETLRKMPFEVNFWQAQNIWNDLLRRSDKTYWSQDWQNGFKKLGEAMNICVDRLEIEEGVSAF